MPNHTDGMTLQEQIGQLFMVGFWGTTVSENIIDLVQRYHVGNIILFARNIQDTQQVLALTHDLQMIAKAAGHRSPLLIAIDQENGPVQRLGPAATQFPGNMALGAIGSEQVTYDIAQATGHELQALGINMNLAPVVDVNNNPANPVIGTRSFGENPHHVARLAAAMVQGYHTAGAITTLKHFPGHGDTAVDSHLALPTIPHTMERLEAVELVPFKHGIAAGADSVMIAHIAFPAITQQDGLSATVSPAIVRGLLREQLGFDGVILSDCLEMQAITETIGVECGSILALQAGTDIVLVSHLYGRQQVSIEAVQAAVQQGELSPETVRQAAERVLSLKQHYLSWESLPTTSGLTIIGNASHQQLRDQAYDLSTTLVRNDAALLPLHLEPSERLWLLSLQSSTLSMVNDREDEEYLKEYLVESIRQYHPQVNTIPLSEHATVDELAGQLQSVAAPDVIVVTTVNAHLDQQQTELMKYLVQSSRRVIGIAVGNPYDLLAFPQLRTYLVTYEYTPPALTAAVRVLFGAIQAQGRLPVSLPVLYSLD
jgi:beta-N-acetylhexosaminidase